MNSFNKFYFLLFVFSAAIVIQSCTDDPSGIDFEEVAPPAFDRSQAVRDSSLGEGLEIFILEEGGGQFSITPNDQIQVRYTGRTKDGQIFDTSYRENPASDNAALFRNLTPSSFQGVTTLIEGFRKGLIGMKEGEKRIIEIPPALGYSNARQGTNGFDLREDTLIFDVELITIF